MKLTENIKSLAEVISTFEQLDSPEFLQEQWLSEEDALSVRDELKLQIENYKSEIQSYIEYKLWERQEHVILWKGIADQIMILADRMKAEENKVRKIDSWIDYLCQIAGITGLKTPLAEIKYTGWDKMKVEDVTVLPEELRSYTYKAEDKEYLKWVLISAGIEIEEIPWNLNDIKKRYKTLSEEQKKELEGKIRIDDSKSISIK